MRINDLVIGLTIIPIIFLCACNDDEGPREIPVESITIVGDYIEDGGTSQLSIITEPANATNQGVEWSVSNEAIATISQTGLLTAVSNGNVSVMATALDGSDVSSSRLFGISGVPIPVIPVESIQIEGNDIADGATSQLTAIVMPENASNKKVVWETDGVDAAVISASGLLTAIDNGTVLVTATAMDGSGVSTSKTFSVSGVVDPIVLVQNITIIGGDITNGALTQFYAEVIPEDAKNKEVEWSVSDTEIAAISSSGLLTPLANGTLTVMATAVDGSNVDGELEVSISGVNTSGSIVTTAEEILDAIAFASAGDKIYIRGGTYFFNTTIRLSANGTSENSISLLAYPGDMERPIFNFSAMSENSSNRGVQLSGDYWYIKGIDIYKAGDNGLNISGNNNTIEFCNFYENADSGLQIGNGGANNTVINCDSYYNADSSIENADGFASKLDAGSGNTFIGCRAWQNLDDGWDGYMRGNDNITTIYENCWAFKNGILKSGAVGGGDGNGFKTGGSDDKTLRHNGVYSNCIAAGNVVDGFDHNSNRGDIVLYNCGAYANGRNISFGSGNIANSLIIKNTISLQGNNNDSYLATNTDITNNSWQDGLSATSADFVSLDIELLASHRKPDGSLPDIDFMKLVQGSDLINKGVDVGLPFNGPAPDLGAFESDN